MDPEEVDGVLHGPGDRMFGAEVRGQIEGKGVEVLHGGVVDVLHAVDQVIGEQRVNELGTALGDEVGPVFLFQALHVGDVAQEH